MANKFQVSTVMELGKVDEAQARVIVEVIENQALVESWSNGTNSAFRTAIKYAKAYIQNGFSWE